MPTAMIFFLQSFICVLILGVIIFSSKWYFTILLSLAFMGGFFNLMDRAFYSSLSTVPYVVIDYLPTLNTKSNFPDVFILIGIIGFAVLFIITTIVKTVQEKHSEDKGPSGTQEVEDGKIQSTKP
jgi:lipoprotein signal peptidase